ncbi:hypothetical protein AAFF_G00306660 [Aldrovandia affinis]|uniref:Uncharacterized protein n=1 Tax=Aldrovandia affinis TaxID=143900 RepID=A0AAD7W114_9TELE|nr:hypothetical protein AAFF_G00306660 [Aldrovandia affinis]
MLSPWPCRTAFSLYQLCSAHESPRAWCQISGWQSQEAQRQRGVLVLLWVTGRGTCGPPLRDLFGSAGPSAQLERGRPCTPSPSIDTLHEHGPFWIVEDNL